MEELKNFQFEEFHIKREGDIIHSILTEEFFLTCIPGHNEVA